MVYSGVSVYHSGWLGDVLELFGSKMLETAESNLGWQCFFGSLLTHQASVLITSTFVFPDQSANQKLKCKRKLYLHEQVATEQFFICHQDLRGIHTYIKDVWWSTTVLYFKLAFVLLRMFFSASFGHGHDLLWRLLDLNLAWRREGQSCSFFCVMKQWGDTCKKYSLSILLVLGNVSPWQHSQHVYFKNHQMVLGPYMILGNHGKAAIL